MSLCTFSLIPGLSLIAYLAFDIGNDTVKLLDSELINRIKRVPPRVFYYLKEYILPLWIAIRMVMEIWKYFFTERKAINFNFQTNPFGRT